MRLNHTLGELSHNNFEEYGEWLYQITVMGAPSATEPWGWQLDGHHLIVNYFVLGDQVVMSPAFWGSEPVTAETGKYAGTSILQDEQQPGAGPHSGLDPPNSARRRSSRSRRPATTTSARPSRTTWSSTTRACARPSSPPAQKQQLLALIGEYVRNMRDGHAR